MYIDILNQYLVMYLLYTGKGYRVSALAQSSHISASLALIKLFVVGLGAVGTMFSRH